MKANELRQKDTAGLKQTLMELAKKLFQLRMRKGSGQLKTNHELRNVRRDIARVKTIMNEPKASVE